MQATGFRRLADGLWWIAKTPYDEADYSRDWTDALAADETIASSVWEVPAGLTAGASSMSGPYTTQWLSGGTAGAIYTVVNRIVTSAGRKFARAFKVQIVEVLG